LSRAQRILLWGSALLLGSSGLAYAYMRYLMRGDDPFSAYNHPAQPWVLDLHLLLAPLLVFGVGWFWGNHVMPKLRRGGRPGRRTGILLLSLVGAMTLSGYLLQTITSEGWRVACAWTHGVTGVLFLGILVGHLLIQPEVPAGSSEPLAAGSRGSRPRPPRSTGDVESARGSGARAYALRRRP